MVRAEAFRRAVTNLVDNARRHARHVAIAAPGYEAYPAPFRTHSQLTSYVGAGSPHPPSRVGCASCHQGDEYDDSFAGAGHTTTGASASADEASAHVVPVVQRSWAPVDRAGTTGRAPSQPLANCMY